MVSLVTTWPRKVVFWIYPLPPRYSRHSTEEMYSMYTMGRKMLNTKIWFCLALFSPSLLAKNSSRLRSSWLKIWVILMPDRFSDR